MEVGLVLFGSFLILLFLGVPVAFAMGIGTLLGLISGDYNLQMLPLMVSRGTSNFTLIAIPYFVLAGNLMNSGGITKRIFDWADACIGHVTGGLAQVNVFASMIFSGISGTASADAAGLGLVEIEAMDSKGYDRAFSTAVTLASSVIGPIIPPSVPFIIYAMLANVSVAKLFMGGLIPGIVVGAILMLTNVILEKTGRVKMPETTPFSWMRLKKTTKDGFFALLAPIILVGSISSGFATATEAGIIAVFYSIFCGLYYKELTIKRLLKSMEVTIFSTAMIMLLIGIGSGSGWVATAERIPAMLSDILFNLTTNKYMLLIIINVFLLFLGMIIDGVTIKLIMVPILLPIIDSIGMSRIHFGIMQTLNGLIGYATPPVGIGLFIMSSITDLKLEEVIKSFWIFYIPLIIALILIIFFPGITMWLPNLLFE